MRRVTAVAVFLLSLLGLVSPQVVSPAVAQDARQRQAAAEAYDRGTAAYVDGAYEEAAQWFETANRLAPAAPALMQAIRAYDHYDNQARAATLALALAQAYENDKAASDFAKGVLDKHASSLLRVEVSCNQDCKLDVDGKLQEFLSFFVTPGNTHHLTATFESGSKKAAVQGLAGEIKNVEFAAPPAPPTGTTPPPPGIGGTGADSDGRKPLAPLYTFIGVGLTGALGIVTIISGLDANAGVPKFEKAASILAECVKTNAPCTSERSSANSLLKQGQGRELRTDILIGATALAAVGTGAIALFLTDWSSDEKPSTASVRLRVEPRFGGAVSVIEGRF